MVKRHWYQSSKSLTFFHSALSAVYCILYNTYIHGMSTTGRMDQDPYVLLERDVVRDMQYKQLDTNTESASVLALFISCVSRCRVAEKIGVIH